MQLRQIKKYKYVKIWYFVSSAFTSWFCEFIIRFRWNYKKHGRVLFKLMLLSNELWSWLISHWFGPNAVNKKKFRVYRTLWLTLRLIVLVVCTYLQVYKLGTWWNVKHINSSVYRWLPNFSPLSLFCCKLCLINEFFMVFNAMYAINRCSTTHNKIFTLYNPDG